MHSIARCLRKAIVNSKAGIRKISISHSILKTYIQFQARKIKWGGGQPPPPTFWPSKDVSQMFLNFFYFFWLVKIFRLSLALATCLNSHIHYHQLFINILLIWTSLRKWHPINTLRWLYTPSLFQFSIEDLDHKIYTKSYQILKWW